MDRRAYLVSAALALGGCSSAGDSEPAGDAESSTGSPGVTRNDTGSNESARSSGDAEDLPEGPGTFDDFEDLSTWVAQSGELSVETGQSYTGSQSALLEAAASESRVRIARALGRPVDFADVVPGLAVASEELVIPRIRLIDEKGDRVDYRRVIKGDLPFMRYNFGVEEIEGDPDLGRVTRIQISLWVGESARRFWCDDLHLVPRPETGKVMIQFDDGQETDYTQGRPVLAEHGYPAVSFVNPGRIGNESVLDLAQLEELADAGWTIASHSNSHRHLSELDDRGQEAEIRDAKQWLLEHGFREGARYFAYPFNDYDATTLDLVRQVHDLGFTGGAPVQGYNVNPAMASRFFEPGAEQAGRILDRTAEMPGISCLLYHELEGGLQQDFEAMVAHLHDLESAGDLDVILPGDLVDEYQF